MQKFQLVGLPRMRGFLALIGDREEEGRIRDLLIVKMMSFVVMASYILMQNDMR